MKIIRVGIDLAKNVFRCTAFIRTRSRFFAGACAPAPDLTGGIYSPAVDDGFYVRLNPLAVGAHTLHIHADNPSAGFTLDVTYNLNVIPVVNK